MAVIKRLLVLILLLAGAVVLYLLLWPVPISPAAWTPPVAPELSGQYQANSRLSGIQRLPLGTGFAPEDVAIDSQSRIYTGIDDGRIMRVRSDGTSPELFANTHGRPLGMKFDAKGNLIVADAVKGLLSIAPDGAISVLSTQAEGVGFGCVNDLDIAADGTIYFTDASIKFPLTSYKADVLEHQPNGRLLAYNPSTKSSRVVLTNLYFANGVAVSPDQSFVLVVETSTYCVRRLWLTGPNQSKSEIFLDNLPAFPDGISSNGKDKFWLALVAPRDEGLDKAMPHPFFRKIVFRLPEFLQPAPKHYSFVLGLDANGKIVDNLQDGSKGCYAEIANVIEHDGFLYFGSIGESAIGRFPLR